LRRSFSWPFLRALRQATTRRARRVAVFP
jgi:hypothetical protein